MSIDVDTAEAIARGRLATDLEPPESISEGDLSRLAEHCAPIATALSRGEELDEHDLEVAYHCAEDVQDTLLEAAALFEIHPWDIGVPMGDLSGQERSELEDRELEGVSTDSDSGELDTLDVLLTERILNLQERDVDGERIARVLEEYARAARNGTVPGGDPER